MELAKLTWRSEDNSLFIFVDRDGNRVKEIDGTILYCCEKLDNHLAAFTMNVAGLEAGDVGIMLDVDFNIATRTGLHCAPLVHTQRGLVPIHGGVRCAIGPFKTEAHIDTAMTAMTDIAERAKKMAAVRTS